MKLKLKFYTFLIISLLLLSICFFPTHTYAASNLELKNLNYKVHLLEDGTANVTETWDISIKKTNTLFKTFKIDNSKYSGITNVSVIETTNASQKSFTQINQEQYHVAKDHFYALKTKSNEFEIAWGIAEDKSSARRTFEIHYTILDAVKNYADCSEFYWQFIGNSSAIPAKTVTGTITLPKAITNLDDLKVWAHGPLNGTIEKSSVNSITFKVNNLNPNTMLEVRIVTPTAIFSTNQNRSTQNRLSTILSQEETWANQANAARKREEDRRNSLLIILLSVNGIGILVAIYLGTKIKKYKQILQEVPVVKPTQTYPYYRDIPDETATPAQAGFLYYFPLTGLTGTHTSDAFSASLLDLCMKKALSFEVLPDKKKEIQITLNEHVALDTLPEDEQKIWTFMKKIGMTFTMKDFQKYCNKHSSSFLDVLNSLETIAKKEETQKGNYDKDLLDQATTWSSKQIGYIFFAIFAFIPMLAASIVSIILAVYANKLQTRFHTLTQAGEDERAKWVGLKNYMKDFSTMDKKQVPELVLWEKYLVFATAFGMADEVLKQLKVIYPEVMDYSYMSTHGYTYLYWMYYGNMNGAFVKTINSTVYSSYISTTNYSSGSGAGGGFSGGGGFGGGGGGMGGI